MKKTTDPTLERIREAKRKISAEHGLDIEKMIAYYQKRQIESEKKPARKVPVGEWSLEK